MQARKYSEGRITGTIADGSPSIKLVFHDGASSTIFEGNNNIPPVLFDMPPSIPDADMATLGGFITAYGDLETTIHRQFETLLGVGYGPAAAISYSTSGNKLITLLEFQLELFDLPEEEYKEFERLKKRMQKNNTVRNRIVHGFWRFILEVILTEDRTKISVEFAREYIPTDIKKRQKLELNDPKIVSQYSFNADIMSRLSSELDKLNSDVNVFFEKLNLKEKFSWGRELQKKPPRI
jgi:hypothetical protein